MYGKNTLDKIYLTQKKLLPHPSTYQRKGKNSHPSPILLPPQRGNSSSFQGQIVIPSEAKRRIVIPSETKGRIAIRPYSSPFTVHCSLPPVHCSLFTVHCFMLKISRNTKKNRTFAPNYFYGGRLVLTASLSIK